MAPLPRASVLARVLRARPSPATGRQAFNRAARRHYASGGGHGQPAKSDIPWMIGAVGVTIPGAYFLLQAPESDHGHGHGHEEHKEEHAEGEEEPKEGEEEEPKEEEPKEEESKDEGKSDEKKDEGDDETKEEEKPEGDDEKEGGDDKEEKSDESGEKKSPGTKESPNVRERDDHNVVKTYADAKGGVKKRLESKNAILQGGKDGGPGRSAGGNVGDANTTTTGAQEGISNTDTKHSIDLQNSPNHSKKGEGDPDTAKVKGTVDTNRAQR